MSVRASDAEKKPLEQVRTMLESDRCVSVPVAQPEAEGLLVAYPRQPSGGRYRPFLQRCGVT